MTKGEYRVWSFNHSADDKVAQIKSAAADLIDLIESIPQHPFLDTDAEIMRLKALAQTAIEEGAMWAVKAATKGPIE
jgi:hypothetical protein